MLSGLCTAKCKQGVNAVKTLFYIELMNLDHNKRQVN